MLKVGFIGAGGRAQDAHYPTVYRMDGVSVQAVCELDTDKLQKVSNKYFKTNCQKKCSKDAKPSNN